METPNPRPADDTSTFQEHRSWLQLQIVKLIVRLTPRCPDVVRLLSLGMEEKLSFLTRIRLRVHYLMCSFCERYAAQLKYMREVSHEFPEKVGDVSTEKLPDEVKQRIREALKS